MSKNALVLERISEPALYTRSASVSEVPRSGQYLELIRRHCHPHSAVAIIAAGPSLDTRTVCESIAAELAACGNRVVVVPGNALLQKNLVANPEASACRPGRIPNVWSWPSTAGAEIEFFKPAAPADPAVEWLDWLRQSFDSVLLDCPGVAASPATVELAAMADAAVLVVEAGRTTRQQIRHDQHALESRAVKLAGCILLQRK